MGQIRFWSALPDRLSQDTAQRAYLVGMDGVPWQSQNRFTGERLIIQRQESESGNLYFPWRTENHGELALCTASLMERAQPYQLEIELARGTINRLRNQLASWQSAGLEPSETNIARIDAATSRFRQAATAQCESTAATLAVEAIEEAIAAIDHLTDEFCQQVLDMRHQQAPKLTSLLGCVVASEPLKEKETEAVRPAFNAAFASLNWGRIEANTGHYDWSDADRQMQWCRQHDFKVAAGPMLRLDRQLLPDWIYLWEDDFQSIQTYLSQYVEAAVRRYGETVPIWHCAAGMNVGGDLSLSEEQRLRLTVASIEAVQRVDSRLATVVSFEKPCGEFMSGQSLDLSPIHFADALVRADLGLAGIGLEINLGYWPGGTQPRDLLDFNRVIDRWSLLGLPLLIFITIPSSAAEDSLASQSAAPMDTGFAGGLSEQAQQDLANRLIPFLFSKQSVHGVVWSQLRDSVAHPFANGGLINSEGEPKPTLTTLAEFRREHLL